MNATDKSAQRRRRALTVADSKKNEIVKPLLRKRRRKLVVRIKTAISQAKDNGWNIIAKPGFMGTIHGQPFYSYRYHTKMDLAIPCQNKPFVCLIQACVHINDEQFKDLALKLLSLNMRYAICSGIEAERLSDLINDLLDCGKYHDNGRSAITSAFEDEPIEEAMEYFILPSGMAPVNLMLAIGNERMFSASLNVFGNVVNRMQSDLS